MSTVADLINGALEVMGVLAAEETCTAAEQTSAFNALNRMLDTWANERLALFATRRDSYVLTAGLNPHTIGTEGSPTFTATRPMKVERASIVLASSPNAELPLTICTDAEWQLVQGKVTTGLPLYLWPQMTHPLVSLWLNPVPVEADTLVLYTPQQIGRFASVSTTFDMPPGYEEAIVYNLAKRLCPTFGVKLSDEAADIAANSFADLKRNNDTPAYARSDAALLRPGPFNIISGDRG